MQQIALQEARAEHKLLASKLKESQKEGTTAEGQCNVTERCWGLTFASGVTTGFGGNCTSVAFRIVFSWRISCCDWLWPKGYQKNKKNNPKTIVVKDWWQALKEKSHSATVNHHLTSAFFQARSPWTLWRCLQIPARWTSDTLLCFWTELKGHQAGTCPGCLQLRQEAPPCACRLHRSALSHQRGPSSIWAARRFTSFNPCLAGSTVCLTDTTMFLSAQAFPIPGYQRLVNTRAYGILFLPNQLLLMSLKKEKIVFSQNKSPLPEIDSSLPKGILKTFSLCIYFILKHLQLLSKLGLTKTLHSKNNIRTLKAW